MKKIAIYPGTFDPITFGHIDVIRKSLNVVDKIIVDLNASGMKDMGKGMSLASQEMMGKADGKTISSIVKSKLSL